MAGWLSNMSPGLDCFPESFPIDFQLRKSTETLWLAEVKQHQAVVKLVHEYQAYCSSYKRSLICCLTLVWGNSKSYSQASSCYNFPGIFLQLLQSQARCYFHQLLLQDTNISEAGEGETLTWISGHLEFQLLFMGSHGSILLPFLTACPEYLELQHYIQLTVVEATKLSPKITQCKMSPKTPLKHIYQSLLQWF